MKQILATISVVLLLITLSSCVTTGTQGSTQYSTQTQQFIIQPQPATVLVTTIGNVQHVTTTGGGGFASGFATGFSSR